MAIETPRGAIVEMLVERGLEVFAINPKQLDRFRDRHTVAGAKDDRRDAFVLAKSLRTDLPSFRRVRLDGPLREQLHRFYPQMLHLCHAADEAWLWALLDLAPTPAHTTCSARNKSIRCSRRIGFAASASQMSWTSYGLRPYRSRLGWPRRPRPMWRCC